MLQQQRINNSAAVSAVETGKKDDEGKLRFDLVDAEFEEQLAAVLTAGANKYGANNWQKVEDAKNRYYAALRRHIAAWRKGEQVDAETGIDHLAHAAANIMFLLHLDKEAEDGRH